MNTATIISAVAKLMRRKLIGDLMGLFSTTASITSVFPTRLITISIEKNMAKPVYIILSRLPGGGEIVKMLESTTESTAKIGCTLK